jgi:hypothetical protein
MLTTHLSRWANLLGIRFTKSARETFDLIQSYTAEQILGTNTHRVVFPLIFGAKHHIYTLVNSRIPRRTLNPEQVLEAFYFAIKSEDPIGFSPYERPKKKKFKK